MTTLVLASTSTEKYAVVSGAWLISLTSDNTRRAYKGDLSEFMNFCDETSLDLMEVQRSHVDVYRQSLTGADSTTARKLSALSSFYSYAMDEGMISSNPVSRVKRPKVDADYSPTMGLTRDQAQALLDAAHADSPRSDALVAILLLTAARISEPLTARLSALQWDSGHRVLVVRRKGGKLQKLVLPPRAISALSDYLGSSAAQGTEIATAGGEDPFLFTTRTGARWDQASAFRTIQRLARTAGIEGKVSPHSLRHTHITLALDAGVPLHVVQDSAGHADPRTTRRCDRARNKLNRSTAYTLAGILS